MERDGATGENIRDAVAQAELVAYPVFLRRHADGPWPIGDDGEDRRPLIRVSPGALYEAVEAAEKALMAAPGIELFDRGGQLVRVVVDREGEARVIPQTARHLVEALDVAARCQRFDKLAKEWVNCHPPDILVESLLAREGRWPFLPLRSVIRAPTVGPDGRIVVAEGYDGATGLYHVRKGGRFTGINYQPSWDDARAALDRVTALFDEFAFAGDDDGQSASRSVALSAVLTAVARPTLATAPMHAFTAPVAGSGKSMAVDITSTIVTGSPAPVLSHGGNDEEFEKRLGAALINVVPVLSIDNVEKPLGGDLLCQLLSQQVVMTRPLGASKILSLPTVAAVFATGNNLTIKGDLTRRALVCMLDPGVERPELRCFRRDPLADAKANRRSLIADCLTVLRGYVVAGRPDQSLSPLGSFDEWSGLVRCALTWLGEPDPVLTMETLRAADPVRDGLAAVLAAWHAAFGAQEVKVQDLIDKANLAPMYADAGQRWEFPDLRDALTGVAATRDVINGQRLGHWIKRHAGRVVDGLRIVSAGKHVGQNRWKVEMMG